MYQLEAFAERRDFKVFDVRKNLPLNDSEKIHYDYYLSIGQDQGVEKGAILTAYRRVPVMDVYRNQNHEDMQIPVAKIKVIYSERTMSVGRVIKLANREKIPVLEFNKVMTGDRVEFAALGKEGESQAFEEAKKKITNQRPRRETASSNPAPKPKLMAENNSGLDANVRPPNTPNLPGNPPAAAESNVLQGKP